jgi:colanic acid/amylovoran biosynthesis protein
VGLRQAVRELHAIDALVIMGGSIFQDNPLYYKYDLRRNVLVTLARLLGKAVFIIGCNIGPIYSRRGARYSRYCFALANAISVRDSASFTQLQSWNCRTPFQMGADLIFSYPLRPMAPPAAPARRLGISVVNVNRPESETAAYVNKLTELAKAHLLQDTSHEVTLFAFNGGASGQNDSVPIARIAGNLTSFADRVGVQEYRPNVAISEFLDSFAACDYIVGSRFHSLILALKFGIPFFPIAYSDKSLNLLHDIGYSGDIGYYASMQELNLESVLTDIAQPQQRSFLSRHYIGTSRKHFAALDDFISRQPQRTAEAQRASEELE